MSEKTEWCHPASFQMTGLWVGPGELQSQYICFFMEHFKSFKRYEAQGMLSLTNCRSLNNRGLQSARNGTATFLRQPPLLWSD